MAPGSELGSRVVSCVIVAFHRPAMLEQLLASLRGNGYELIVVNVEDDPALRAIDGATSIPMVENRGYAAGVNAGARVAHGGVVVFMNDDISMAGDVPRKLAERIRCGDTDVAMPLVEDEQGELELAEKIPYRLARRMLLKGEPVPTVPIRVDAAWAVVVAVRRDVLTANPLPEVYFMYWEELEWFHALRALHTRIELEPQARVIHHGGPDKHSPEKSRLMARNAVRCVRRVRGARAAVFAWPHVIGWQCRLLLTAMLLRAPREDRRAHRAGVSAACGAWSQVRASEPTTV